jgi:CBS domain-containing protein
MITDRDICIALATRGRPAGELRAGELLNGRLFTCSPDDTVQTALRTMRDAKVRRLAVVDASGALQGILSINDVIRQAQNGRGGGSPVSYEETMGVLKALCAHVAEEASRPVIHSSEATARRKRGRAALSAS